MQKMVGRNKDKDELGVSDAELEPFGLLFKMAYDAIDHEKEKAMVIRNLAKDLTAAGFPQEKVCRAITKKLGIASLEDGKKYANRDYIQKILDSKYKDYVHGKKRPVLEKEKQDLIRQQEEKEKKLMQNAKKLITTTHRKPLNEKKMSGIEADIKKEIEIAKENGLESAIELEDSIELEEPELEPEIEISESEPTDTIIDIPAPVVKGPTVKEKAEEMQAQLNELHFQIERGNNQIEELQSKYNTEHLELAALKEDYAELLNKYNEAIKPFMERQWIQVNVLNPETGKEEPSIIEFDIVANAITRRIKIPRDIEEKKIKYKRRLSGLQEKEAHEAEWKRITKGKLYLDVKIVKPKDEDTMTASELQE